MNEAYALIRVYQLGCRAIRDGDPVLIKAAADRIEQAELRCVSAGVSDHEAIASFRDAYRQAAARWEAAGMDRASWLQRLWRRVLRRSQAN